MAARNFSYSADGGSYSGEGDWRHSWYGDNSEGGEDRNTMSDGGGSLVSYEYPSYDTMARSEKDAEDRKKRPRRKKNKQKKKQAKKQNQKRTHRASRNRSGTAGSSRAGPGSYNSSGYTEGYLRRLREKRRKRRIKIAVRVRLRLVALCATLRLLKLRARLVYLCLCCSSLLQSTSLLASQSSALWRTSLRRWRTWAIGATSSSSACFSSLRKARWLAPLRAL